MKKLKELWSKPKGRVMLISAASAVVVLVAVGVFLALRTTDYITIQVYDLDGDAEIQRQDVGTIDAYANMLLQSGDRGTTFVDSWLYLRVDNDKYILAEPETRFTVTASGTKQDSRIRLDLEIGALVNHITEPLSKKSSYEVTTPNSTMAVRGTSFRVEVWFDEDGVSHTKLQVFEGVVEVHLVYPDGSISEEGRLFTAGQTVLIWGNDETSDYEYVENEIDYYSLKIPTLEFLKIGIKNFGDYDITLIDVNEVIRIKQTYFPVSFTVDGELFGSQSILFDNYATEPSLRPTPNGRWDYDFDVPIRGDVEIPWIAG